MPDDEAHTARRRPPAARLEDDQIETAAAGTGGPRPEARGGNVPVDVRCQIVDLLPRLRRFACALTGDMDRGDDLVQETCARALARLDQWQENTRLDSWMYRIAQNIWYDRIRALKLRGEVVEIDAAHDLPGDDGRDITESRITLSEVAGAIANLPPDQRIVVALVCVDGLSYKEAAEIVEVPIGTIMSWLARARVALGATLEAGMPTVEATVVEYPRGRRRTIR